MKRLLMVASALVGIPIIAAAQQCPRGQVCRQAAPAQQFRAAPQAQAPMRMAPASPQQFQQPQQQMFQPQQRMAPTAPQQTFQRQFNPPGGGLPQGMGGRTFSSPEATGGRTFERSTPGAQFNGRSATGAGTERVFGPPSSTLGGSEQYHGPPQTGAATRGFGQSGGRSFSGSAQSGFQRTGATFDSSLSPRGSTGPSTGSGPQGTGHRQFMGPSGVSSGVADTAGVFGGRHGPGATTSFGTTRSEAGRTGGFGNSRYVGFGGTGIAGGGTSQGSRTGFGPSPYRSLGAQGAAINGGPPAGLHGDFGASRYGPTGERGGREGLGSSRYGGQSGGGFATSRYSGQWAGGHGGGGGFAAGAVVGSMAGLAVGMALATPDPGGPVYVFEGHRHAPFWGGDYLWPPGYGYQELDTGGVMPPAFLTPGYMIDNYSVYGLPAPPPQFRWVRYGPDMVLVRLEDNAVMKVVRGVFVAGRPTTIAMGVSGWSDPEELPGDPPPPGIVP